MLVVFLILIETVFCFNYENTDNWANDIPQCAGNFQSPLNINDWEAKYDPSLTDIQYNNYNENLRWNCTHNGHTIIFLPILHGDNTLSFFQNTLGEVFTIAQFHFHWGNDEYEGSEHFIDGNKYPAELHLVHKSDTNKFAVLGFFFELSENDNELLNTMVDGVSNAYDSSHSINLNLVMSDIITDGIRSGSYYRYSGSLTTPPCTEGIIWTVFETPIRISRKQLAAFHVNSIDENFRNPQKLYNRTVFSNRVERRKNPVAIQRCLNH